MALIRMGANIIGLSLVGDFGLDFVYGDSQRSFSVQLQSGDLVTLLPTLGFGLGFVMVIGGLALLGYQTFEDKARRRRQRVIVVEQLSLRGGPNQPLRSHLPSRFDGHLENIFHDIRDHFVANAIPNPKAALDYITSIKDEVVQRTAGHDRADISVVYGGRMTVPFTFVTGVLLGDEGTITVLDWDRKPDGGWKELDAPDDGERFEVSPLDAVNADEVVLAISVSYPVAASNVEATFPGHPVVTMKIPSLSSDRHWSIAKQGAWSMEFLQVLKQLSGRGVKRIHLILAAPNSVSFEFGRRYDEALLPECIVYFFLDGHQPPYPWGVRVPKHDRKADIVMRASPSS